MNFIEELFYGNLQPSVRCFSENSEYAKTLSTASQNEQALNNALEGELKSHFLAFIDAQSALNSITAYESFLDGFLLGAGFMRDTFLIKPDRNFREL